MSEQLSSELLHWIPTPIMAAALWFFFWKWLRGHEERLGGLVTKLETAASAVTAHDYALKLLERTCAGHESEIIRLRDRQHELAEELQLIIGRLDGSGPKPWPRRSP